MGNQMGYEGMALSSFEKKGIFESWMVIRRKLSMCGQSVILILLEDNPQHLQYFPVKYKGNPDLAETLGLKVMREFSRIVANLDAISEIEVYLRDVAQFHHAKHIPASAFDDMRRAVLKMIRRHLGTHRHCSVYIHCWDKLLRLVNQILTDCMLDLSKQMSTPRNQQLPETIYQQQNTPKYEPPVKITAGQEQTKISGRLKRRPSVTDL